MGVRLLAFVALIAGCNGEAVLRLGEVTPYDALVSYVPPLDAKCREKLRRDREAAQQLAPLPIGSFALANLCNQSAFPPKEASRNGGGVVFFIMTHTYRGIPRLLRRLKHARSYFVINLDADADTTDHTSLRSHRGERVALLDPPVDVEWGDYTMLTAEMQAMKVALQAWKGWDHMMVMSGADYPVVPADAVHAFFARHPGASYYYLNDDGLDEAGWELMMTQLVGVCSQTRVFHLGWRDDVFRRKGPGGFEFHVGNTWKFWERAFVEWVVRDDILVPPLLDLVRLTLSADELFWPTLHRNSPYCTRVADIRPRDFYYFLWPPSDPERVCPTSITLSPIDWYCPKRPLTFLPPDFSRLLGIPSLFIRKVDPVISAPLLDTIDDDMCYEQPSYRVKLCASIGCFSFAVSDPPRELAVQGITTLLDWGWKASAPTTLRLTDCTHTVLTAPPCLQSLPSPLFGLPAHCRIRPQDSATLCLTVRDSLVVNGSEVGFAPCSDYREGQIFEFVGCQVASAARVAKEAPNSHLGLCLTVAGPSLHGMRLQRCDGSVSQQIRLA